jgi:hypothetical protein
MQNVIFKSQQTITQHRSSGEQFSIGKKCSAVQYSAENTVQYGMYVPKLNVTVLHKLRHRKF